MNENYRLKYLKLGRHFAALGNVSCYLLDACEKSLTLCGGNDFCKSCDFSFRGIYKTHEYGLNEACRWNGKYLYCCSIGLLWISSVIGAPDSPDGALIAGPVVLGSYSDTFGGIGIMSGKMTENAGRLPVLTTEAVNSLSEILHAASSGAVSPEKSYLRLNEPEPVAAPDAGSRHRRIILRAMEYVSLHYLEPFSLKGAAEYVGLSPAYLSGLFKAETGLTLTAFVNRHRVEAAKTLLLNTSMSIVDVAWNSGFNDQSYFTRVFRKNTGVSPKKFRNYRGNI